MSFPKRMLNRLKPERLLMIILTIEEGDYYSMAHKDILYREEARQALERG